MENAIITTIITALVAGGGAAIAVTKLYINSLINDKIEKQRKECKERCKECKDDTKEHLKEIKETMRLIFGK